MSDTPDYAALVNLFPILRNCVDGCGEVTLTVEEAERIRSLGFVADAGRWKVPPLPFELVRDNPLLENLSIGWDTYHAENPVTAANGTRKDVEVRRNKIGSEYGFQAPVTPDRISAINNPIPTRTRVSQWNDPQVLALSLKIQGAIQRHGGQIAKRRLQQRFWRYPARIFNQALERLVIRGQVILTNNCFPA